MITHIPGIPYGPTPSAAAVTGSLAWPPRLVVIHDTGNMHSTAQGEASYAASRTDPQSQWTSAHCYVDSRGPLGSLTLDKRAWAAFSYANANGFHVEICQPDKSNPTAIGHAAAVTRALCQAAGIPMVKLTPAQVAAGQRGICGHHDVTVGLGVGDHTDPDPFDWSQFMSKVVGASAAATREDEDMGASFGPITIEREGETSLTIPPVERGAADPRAAWVNFSNAATCALRIWLCVNDSMVPFKPADGAGGASSFDSDGKRVFPGGRRLAWPLPAGTSGVYVSRKGITGDGTACEPTVTISGQQQPNPAMVTPPSTAHLTLCIERGPVIAS